VIPSTIDSWVCNIFKMFASFGYKCIGHAAHPMRTRSFFKVVPNVGIDLWDHYAILIPIHSTCDCPGVPYELA